MKHINVSLFVPHLGCPHTCVFCNQKTISGQTAGLKPQDIVSACETAAKCPHDIRDSEIAFFGGSFTAIDRETMLSCLQTASPYVGTQFGGIRVSTRPDCIDGEVLSLLKGYGVTAIELGAQSMREAVLVKNERGHTPEDTVKAAALIREYGFSLGLQMMTGLYGSTPEDDRYTAECFIKIKPDTVRIYPTVVLENTRLAELYRAGEYTPYGFEETVSLCAELLLRFTDEHIRVIRLGLHSGGNVEEGYVAGVYHPAFRELCENEIFRKKAEALLTSLPEGSYTLDVPMGAVSKMTGQKKSNLRYFADKGYLFSVQEAPELSGYTVRIKDR